MALDCFSICSLVFLALVLAATIGGYFMAFAGCAVLKQSVFNNPLFWCEEVGNQQLYTAGRWMTFLGLLSLFPIICCMMYWSFKRGPNEQPSEQPKRSPQNGYDTLKEEPDTNQA